ncbi:MAG: hypothetical protein K2Z81_01920 [Cyanobacteria bacterium]|nr:hypothetical protein [Cyanobacteriota bacterium]
MTVAPLVGKGAQELAGCIVKAPHAIPFVQFHPKTIERAMDSNSNSRSSSQIVLAGSYASVTPNGERFK